MVILRSINKLPSLGLLHQSIRRASNQTHICVIGSGTAGYYTAECLLKADSSIVVDVYEKLPVPFGLVRYGVAPDNQDVKNVVNNFSKTMARPGHNFYGNVDIGRDITLKDLQDAYHYIIMSYGSSEERLLHIPGENLGNVISAKRFVGWYNGVPNDVQLNPNLDVEEVSVIGHGNVSLDIARILLKPIDKLKSTDITEHALDKLRTSRVKRVRIIGRRGLLQVSFTTREIRDMLKVSEVGAVVHLSEVERYRDILPTIKPPLKRCVSLLYETAVKHAEESSSSGRSWEVLFQRSPLECLGSSSGDVKAIRLGLNSLDKKGLAVPTGKTEEIECGMVVRSIGYKGTSIDRSLPFDENRGLIESKSGRVERFPGMYAIGWIQQGPVANISRTSLYATQLGQEMVADIGRNRAGQPDKPGRQHILEILSRKGVEPVTLDGWQRIDRTEKERGRKLGKIREKILSFDEMIRIARGS